MLKASGREGLDPRIAVVALMAVAAVAAALLEVTVFNLNHWLTRGSQPYELAAVRTEQVDGTDVYVFDAPADLSLVQVSFQGEITYNQLLDVTFWGSDQGQPGLHKLGEAEMWPYNPRHGNRLRRGLRRRRDRRVPHRRPGCAARPVAPARRGRVRRHRPRTHRPPTRPP